MTRPSIQTQKAGSDPGLFAFTEPDCFCVVIASEAKQSRIFPLRQSGLLRRKSSSQ
jgi:hypothetical protein